MKANGAVICQGIVAPGRLLEPPLVHNLQSSIMRISKECIQLAL